MSFGGLTLLFAAVLLVHWLIGEGLNSRSEGGEAGTLVHRLFLLLQGLDFSEDGPFEVVIVSFEFVNFLFEALEVRFEESLVVALLCDVSAEGILDPLSELPLLLLQTVPPQSHFFSHLA